MCVSNIMVDSIVAAPNWLVLGTLLLVSQIRTNLSWIGQRGCYQTKPAYSLTICFLQL